MRRKIQLALVSVLGMTFTMSAQEAENPIMRNISVGNRYVWVGTDTGLYQFDKTNGESKMFTHAKNAPVRCLAAMPDDKVAVYFADPMDFTGRVGFVFYNGEEAVDTLSKIKVDKETVPVQAFAMTYSGGLIYSVGASIYRQESDGWKNYFDQQLGLSSNYYHTALQYEPGKSRLWFTSTETWPGVGYLGYHSETEGFVYFPEVPKSRDLYVSDSGSAYVATVDGVWVCQEGSASKLDIDLGENASKCMSVSGSGKMVCFSANDVLAKSKDGVNFEFFTNPAAKSDDYITSVKADGRYIWVAFRKSGLYLFDNGEFKNANSGVEGVEAEDVEADDAMYDLQGRRLGAPAKGTIYIQGGKKRVML